MISTARRPVFFAVVMSLLAMAVAADPGSSTAPTFAGRTWSIEVPPGYEEMSQPLNDRGVMTAFAPAPREDGTRPLVQVTLMDLTGSSGTPEFRRKVAETMIAGIQKRRDEWQVETSEAKVGEIPVIRYAWRGVTVPAADGAPVRARVRGVMFVGFHGSVAFALHTQDVDAHADETLPLNEKVLGTFRIR